MAANNVSDSNEIFSKFPDDIIEKIVSCLTLKERPTTSLVSKKWHHMITSLNNDRTLVRTHSAKISCGYCYTQLNPPISCVCTDTETYCVDPTIKLDADNMSFKELYLLIPPNFRYCASPQILDSRLLTILHIKGNCNLNVIREFNVMPSLKEIYFHSVCIFSRTFSDLIPKCPFLVELTLIHCDQPTEFTVPDLNYLKKLHINSRKRNKIEVKARNLLEFHFCSSSALTKIDFSACTELQVLNIDSTYVTDSFPQEVCSAFPSLKSLSLRFCRGLKKIKIMSPQVESLTFSDMIDLDDAFIVTPSLHSFNIINTFKFHTPCPMVGSNLMEVRMDARATNSLLELRTFAEKLGGSITLSLETDATGAKEITFHPGNLESNLQPLCVERMNLVIQSSLKPRYESFLAKLFGYFHPRTLLVTVNSDARKHDFIQVLMNELEGWNRDGTKHYKRSEYMSWFNALKRFTIHASTTITTQEREAQCSKPQLCAELGEGSNQKELLVDLPNISSVTRQEREARCGKPPLCTGLGEGSDQKGLYIELPKISSIKRQEREARGTGSREGVEQQCMLYVALPNLSTITRQGAHQINLELKWYK